MLSLLSILIATIPLLGAGPTGEQQLSPSGIAPAGHSCSGCLDAELETVDDLIKLLNEGHSPKDLLDKANDLKSKLEREQEDEKITELSLGCCWFRVLTRKAEHVSLAQLR